MTEYSNYVRNEAEIEHARAVKQEEVIRTHIEKEKQALGHMMQDEHTAIIGCKILSQQYFVHPYNEHIFKVIKHCIDNKEAIETAFHTITSITDEDWKNIDPNQPYINHREYITSCIISTFGSINRASADKLFHIIKNQFIHRQIIKDHSDRLNTILTTSSLMRNTKDLLIDISTKAQQMLEQISDDSELRELKDIILERLNKKMPQKIPTGFKPLDQIIGGLTPSNLVTIGGAPGRGKSAFALNLALNITASGGKVAIWSFEMNNDEVSDRVLAIRTGINFSNNEILDEEHYNTGRQYLDNIQDEIKVSTADINNLDNFYLLCRNLKNKNDLKVVIIDYLQLIHLYQNYDSNRVREITHITNTLKKMAQELNIVIIILSQFSKEVTKRVDDTPNLSDLKDSSSIEQDSNLVLLLHKPPKPDGAASYPIYEDNIINVIVAKNRNGKTGKCSLYYNGHLTKFTE
jgi:replicative DNA helicase